MKIFLAPYIIKRIKGDILSLTTVLIIIAINLMVSVSYHYFNEYIRKNNIKKIIHSKFEDTLFPTDNKIDINQFISYKDANGIKKLNPVYRYKSKYASSFSYFFPGYWNVNPGNFGFGVVFKLKKPIKKIKNSIVFSKSRIFSKQKTNLNLSKFITDSYFLIVEDENENKDGIENLANVVESYKIDYLEINMDYLFVFSVFGDKSSEDSCAIFIKTLLDSVNSVCN